MAEVESLAVRSPHAGEFDLDLWRARSPRADGRRSHKHQASNTVISAPRRLSEDTFELDLLVDEDCELMADHQTGQHLQGMLLIEAARQSFLAVTEMFYLPDDGTRYYFVFDDLSARYKRFVFPVDARLVYRVRNVDPTPGRQRFTVDVAVEQCGDEAAVISGTFTVVKDARITRMEAGLAREAVNTHVAVAAQARASLRARVSEAA
ncbi:MAG: AfsA-related hotdog domain-containing protein [Solirubrobacterales bacterium]